MMLSLADVCNYTLLTEYKVRKLIKEDKFPTPVELNSNKHKWFVCEIREWLKRNNPFQLEMLDKFIEKINKDKK